MEVPVTRFTIKKVDNKTKLLRSRPAIFTAAATTSSILAAKQLVAWRIGRRLMRLQPVTDQIARTDADRQWSTPMAQRPILQFDKGQALQMCAIAKQIQEHSPAAAIALLDFLALQQHEYQPHARGELTTLLQRFYPNDLARRSAQAGDFESRQTHDGQLTTALCRYELDFMLGFYGQADSQTLSFEELSGELNRIINLLEERHSQRRQGAARLILADIQLRFGYISKANRQMRRAITLLATVHDNGELLQIDEVNQYH